MTITVIAGRHSHYISLSGGRSFAGRRRVPQVVLKERKASPSLLRHR